MNDIYKYIFFLRYSSHSLFDTKTYIAVMSHATLFKSLSDLWINFIMPCFISFHLPTLFASILMKRMKMCTFGNNKTATHKKKLFISLEMLPLLSFNVIPFQVNYDEKKETFLALLALKITMQKENIIQCFFSN
jgi:hypothetical protein